MPISGTTNGPDRRNARLHQPHQDKDGMEKNGIAVDKDGMDKDHGQAMVRVGDRLRLQDRLRLHQPRQPLSLSDGHRPSEMNGRRG